MLTLNSILHFPFLGKSYMALGDTLPLKTSLGVPLKVNAQRREESLLTLPLASPGDPWSKSSSASHTILFHSIKWTTSYYPEPKKIVKTFYPPLKKKNKADATFNNPFF